MAAKDVIEGFVKKIRIEMDTIERYPFVEDIFMESKKRHYRMASDLSELLR